MTDLGRLAAACLCPSFPGHTVPAWVERWLERGLGGITLFAYNVRDPEQLAALTAALRERRPELLVSIDEEGGDVTRLEADRGSSYPGNLALGVVDDVELTEQVASAIGADLARVGVNLNLAPVADVNSDPRNPVIGVRSFGSDPGARRPPRGGVRARAAAAGRGGLRQALPGARRHVGGLAPRAPGRARRPRRGARAVPGRDRSRDAGGDERSPARARARRRARHGQPARAHRPAPRRARLRRPRADGRAGDARDQRRHRCGGGRRAGSRRRRRRGLPRARPARGGGRVGARGDPRRGARRQAHGRPALGGGGEGVGRRALDAAHVVGRRSARGGCCGRAARAAGPRRARAHRRAARPRAAPGRERGRRRARVRPRRPLAGRRLRAAPRLSAGRRRRARAGGRPAGRGGDARPGPPRVAAGDRGGRQGRPSGCGRRRDGAAGRHRRDRHLRCGAGQSPGGGRPPRRAAAPATSASASASSPP